MERDEWAEEHAGKVVPKPEEPKYQIWRTSTERMSPGYGELRRTRYRVHYNAAFRDIAIPLAELIQFCIDNDLSVEDVTINRPHLHYFLPETEEQKKGREEWEHRKAEGKEKWERQTYERLREKYEGDDLK